MNKFITLFFCFVLSGGAVGCVYVVDKMETAFATHQPTGHDIEAEIEGNTLQQKFAEARSQGGVEELLPNS